LFRQNFFLVSSRATKHFDLNWIKLHNKNCLQKISIIIIISILTSILTNYEVIEQSSQQHSIVIESTINPNDTLWDVNSMENSIEERENNRDQKNRD